MTTLMRDSEADDRFRAMLVWTFAGLATVLAAIGIFGVTARMVAVRWRELGIRSALGAQGHDLVLLVLRKQLRIALPGIAIGMMGAFWASRLIESLLYGIHARDPLTYAVVGVLASVTCMVAAYVPARRATRIPVADIAGR